MKPDDPRSPRDRGPSFTALKEAVRRDVEDLLNTRWRCTKCPEHLEELRLSLMSYGLPDFTGANLNTPDNQRWFRETVRSTIDDFEPRLANVRVELVDSFDSLDRTLRFRIDAVLDLKPEPLPITFDSAFEPMTAECKVTGERR
jgi:type VI secretion system protein ImpF